MSQSNYKDGFAEGYKQAQAQAAAAAQPAAPGYGAPSAGYPQPGYGYDNRRRGLPGGGLVVRLIHLPIGLVTKPIKMGNDAYKNYSEKKKVEKAAAEADKEHTRELEAEHAAHQIVEVPAEQADRLIASGHAVRAEEGHEPTHELVSPDGYTYGDGGAAEAEAEAVAHQQH
jgi:hypothetical protein